MNDDRQTRRSDPGAPRAEPIPWFELGLILGIVAVLIAAVLLWG